MTVASESEIPEGRGLTLRAGNRFVALFRVGNRVHAIDAECPHRRGPLADGIVEGGRVFCPLHGWEFDLESGACIDHPGLPVKTFPVRIENGQVQIRI